MKKPRFTEQQVAQALRQAEHGTPAAEVCRKLGVSEATFYAWRTKFGGMSAREVQRLKELEKENARLKRLLAEKVVEIDCLKEVTSKNW